MALRLRVEYEKGRELKYLSHLQLMRLVERVLRRAEIPYALSEGFNPHIKLSLGTVLPVGVWGTSEYFDVETILDMTLDEFAKRMKMVSPPGFIIKQVREIPSATPSLQTRVNAAAYRLTLTGDSEENQVHSVIAAVMAASKLVIPGRGKKNKVKDLRPGIYKLECYRKDGSLEILAAVKAGDGENVRPDELVEGLKKYGLNAGVVDICRYGNYVKEGDVYISPLDDIEKV